MLTPEELESMIAGYLECAAWADAPEGSTSQFTVAAKAEATSDCRAFVAACGPLARQAVDTCGAVSFGHDFWLTRCGHGTGFWDRDGLEVECKPVPMVDRNGKAYEPDDTSLGGVLSAIAYGTHAAISHFAYPSVSAYGGWLHFD